MGYPAKGEAHVHGKSWEKQAAGYFTDKKAAEPFVNAIMKTVEAARPSAIADMGGGTGFVLERLIEAGLPDSVKLSVVDLSESQLSECRRPRINPVLCAVESMKRADVAGEAGGLMLISRSVMQYAGLSGQRPWLASVRRQMEAGEYFVHQPGCTEDPASSGALNGLFRMMGVDKWVPCRAELSEMLAGAGFETLDDFPVSPAPMESGELIARYGVDPDVMARIGVELERTCTGRIGLYTKSPGGFTFNFPYRVLVCRACG